jgi:DNA polymerase-3 subunit delta'
VSVYASIVGHKRPIALLERARKNGRVAHAYLFQGPDGVGKEQVAWAFAMALNCKDPLDAPCGHCDSCRKIARSNHPDVRLVACEEEQARRIAILSEEERARRGLSESERRTSRAPSIQIRNEDLDELTGLFSHRPYLGAFKVVLVIDAQRMNQSAQNRFLKSLEEPNADTVIILISSQPAALLPTVRSRCQSLTFGPLPRALIEQWLVERRQLDPIMAQVVASMSQGSLGRALQLTEGEQEGGIAWRDQLLAQVGRIRSGDLADVLEVAEGFAEGGDGQRRLRESLNLLELWCRDLILTKLQVNAQYYINQDRLTELEQTARGLTLTVLLSWIASIARIRQSLGVNANPRLASEALWLELGRP